MLLLFVLIGVLALGLPLMMMLFGTAPVPPPSVPPKVVESRPTSTSGTSDVQPPVAAAPAGSPAAVELRMFPSHR